MTPAPDLRLGRWQDALAGVTCDVLCCDPPYSERVAKGARSAWADGVSGPMIDYGEITTADTVELAQSWAPRVRHWAIIFCDHVSFQWHSDAWDTAGWHTFAPVWWRRRSVPRFGGDGPTTPGDMILIARPRKRIPKDRAGSRPGFYVAGHDPADKIRHGQKPTLGMRRLLTDYVLPGDVVCDPYAGGGSALLAAQSLGCTAIGSECDEATHALAAERIRAALATPLLDWAAARG